MLWDDLNISFDHQTKCTPAARIALFLSHLDVVSQSSKGVEFISSRQADVTVLISRFD